MSAVESNSKDFPKNHKGLASAGALWKKSKIIRRTKSMGSKEFLEKSKQVVVDYFNSHADKIVTVMGDLIIHTVRNICAQQCLVVLKRLAVPNHESRKPMWTLTKNGRILW